MISKLIYALFKTKGLLGVDIGLNSVKLSRVKAGSHKLKAVECGSFPLDIPENASSADRISLVSSKMREIIRKSGIGCRNAAILLSENEVRIAYSLLDRRPEDSFREACRKEAARLFFNSEDMLIDYDIVGEVLEDGVPKVRVVFAGAKKETVSEKVLICEQAGLEPVIVIPAPFAFERLLNVVNGKNKENSLFVKLGKKNAEMCLMSENRVFSVRSVAVGSSMADNEISGKLNVQPEVAEEIKKRYEIPLSDEEKIAVLDRFSREESASIAAKRHYLDLLVAEIDPFVYLSDVKISSVTVSGGPAASDSVCQFLERHLKLPVSIFPKDLNISKKTRKLMGGEVCSYVPSAAASLSLTHKSGLTDINLLPFGRPKYGKGIAIAVKALIYISFAAMIAALFAIHGTEVALKDSLAAKTASLAAAAVQEEAPELEALHKELDELSDYVSKSESIVSSRALSAGLTREISETLPNDVFITSMVVEENGTGGLSVAIKAMSKNTEAISGWIDVISKREGFSKSSSESATKDPASENYYVMPVRFEYRGGIL